MQICSGWLSSGCEIRGSIRHWQKWQYREYRFIDGGMGLDVASCESGGLTVDSSRSSSQLPIETERHG